MSSQPAGPTPRRYLPLLGLALVGLCAAAVSVHWSGADTADNAARGSPGLGRGGPLRGVDGRPVPVVARPVRRGDVQVYLTGIGTATPRNQVTVRSRVDGQLNRIAYQEGQTVQTGDLLAEIDPRPFEVQLLQAQGALARDTALLDNARSDLERYRALERQGSVSKQQSGTQKALVAQYEGAVKSDQAQIAAARLQLAYCRITAPIGGRVGLRQIDPGNIVRAADAAGLATITELAPIAVRFTLPEGDLPTLLRQVRSGGRLSVDAYDKDRKTRLASGFLLTLDNQIDPTTGTIRLKAEFPNEDGSLFPNQFVTARLLIDTLHDAALVPTAAIQRGVPGNYVYVVGPQRTVSVRPVKLGPAQGDETAVAEGLTFGDLVVVDGVDKLREGALVQVNGRENADHAGPAAPPESAPGAAPGAIPVAGEGRRHRRPES